MIDGISLEVSVDGEEVTALYQNELLPSYYEMWFSFATHHQKDGQVWSEDRL